MEPLDRPRRGARVRVFGACAVALASFAGLACGSGAQAARRSTAEARAYHYQDSSGLLVGTYGAGVTQRLPAGASVEARALADYVHLDPDRGFDPTRPGANRQAPDAVTSASATVGGGAVADKWRVEGQLGGDLEREVHGVPISIGAVARGSREVDYRSISGGLRGAVSAFERNLTITALVIHGADRVAPVEAPRGHEAAWPARHRRWAASLGVTQLLGPTLVLVGGGALTLQRGTLSSPYRRAVVAPNLLMPEALPGTRERGSAFVGLSWSMASRLALHARQGVYADSWHVRAFIPEVQLAAEVDPGIVLAFGYRYYRQRAASFYEVTYDDPRSVMTGDLRLGPLSDHTFSVDLRRRLVAADREMPLHFGYGLSVLDHLATGSHVVAHVFSLGLGASY